MNDSRMCGDTRITTPATQEIAITAALAKCAVAVDPVAHGRWAFRLSNGADLAASARVDDGWLLLDAPLGFGSSPVAHAWQLLQWNATLGGGARFVLRSDQPGPRVRAELPLDEEVDLRRRILEACAGLKAAKRSMVCELPGTSMAGTGDAPNGNLAELCRQAMWPFVEREPGRLAVDLDVPGAFQQASVEMRGDLSVAVAVPVLDAAVASVEPPAHVCRQALGLLLVRVCGIVRMARAAAEMRDGMPQARFEVVFESQPCAAELTHAFAALSVACRLASREAAVLWGDEGVARAYVEQWDQTEGGPSWDRQQQ
jgi:hypothetical protein